MKQLLNAQRYSHFLLHQIIKRGDTVVDGTMGNGYDTVFLAELVGESGTVIACDIQEQALYNTTQRLKESNLLKQCQLHCIGHEHLDKLLSNTDTLTAAIFNLGYLPKTDKQIITKGETTISAISHLLPKLKQNGLIVLVVYYGHDGGKEEQQALLNYVKTLSQKEYAVLYYQFINQANNPPQVIAIEKL